MRLIRSVLAKNPTLKRFLCQARIALGMGTAGAYTALGHLRSKEGQHLAAAQAYWRAIQADPNGSIDPYVEILNLLVNCPAILESKIGDAPIDPKHAGSIKQRDWNQLSFGLGKSVTEICTCLDRAADASPLDLDLHRRTRVLLRWVGEYKAFMSYTRRLLDAQRQIARLRGLDNKGVRYIRDSWICNIGHISLLDRPIKARLLGWQTPGRWVILAPQDKIANKVYLDYYRPHVDEIITDPQRVEKLQPEAECLEEYYDAPELNNEPVFWQQAQVRIQQQWEVEGRPPLLRLRQEDDRRGQERLRQLGVPEGAWYVGLHVRETSGFHKQEDNQLYRNASIAVCEQAIQSITARGGWVIRMGNPTMTRLKPASQVIDYAHSDLRCDWMDVFLCASMRFMVGTCSGLTHVPATFGVPTISTNWTHMCLPPWHRLDMFIPKLCWSDLEKRYLSLDEILSSGAGFAVSDRLYLNKHIRLIENDAADINNVVVEMLDRLDGRPNSTDDDSLQQRWKNIGEPHGVICLSRVSSAFVKKHAFLLG